MKPVTKKKQLSKPKSKVQNATYRLDFEVDPIVREQLYFIKDYCAFPSLKATIEYCVENVFSSVNSLLNK